MENFTRVSKNFIPRACPTCESKMPVLRDLIPTKYVIDTKKELSIINEYLGMIYRISDIEPKTHLLFMT